MKNNNETPTTSVDGNNNSSPADSVAAEPKVAELPKAAAKKRKKAPRVKRVPVAEILANEIEEKLQGGNLPGAHSEADKNEFGAAATTPNSTESGVVETPNSSTSVPPQNAEGNRNDAAPQPVPAAPAKQRFDIGGKAAQVARNYFKHKALSSFAVNIAMGCRHACTVCYVPEVATIKQREFLALYGVNDPDAEWGKYLVLRPFDAKVFRKSLRRAQKIPDAKLNSDGNRAVIFCSTTDPYQFLTKADSPNYDLLNAARRQLVRRSLELIRDESTLRVRILTRSPLAKEDFELFRSFGPRLVFGLSLPTLDERLMRIYEPKAPGARARLKTLQEAKQAGLHVYVAMAPTYPDCTEADLRATLAEIRKLDPITVFHEPVNIRAENVERIRAHAARIGEVVNLAPLESREGWRRYATDQLFLVEQLCEEMGLEPMLKLWPDPDLGSKAGFVAALEHNYQTTVVREGDRAETAYQRRARAREFAARFPDFKCWLQKWWNRKSQWPA